MKEDYYTDILLVSCPSKVMDYPALAMPALTGFLENKGINVIQRDLNIKLKDMFFEKESMEYLYYSFVPIILRLNITNQTEYKKLKQFYYYLNEVNQSFSFDELEELKKKCQARDYKFIENKRSMDLLEMIFNISRCYDFFISYICQYYLHLKENNMLTFFTDFIRDVVKEILELNPVVIGLSMIITQNTFSLWFAEFLKKECGYKGYILYGGSQPTKYEEQYLHDNPFADFIIVGEGEYPLFQLISELKKDIPELHKVPRLIYRQEKEVIKNNNILYLESCYEAPFPSYKGLPLELYLSPIFPILASSNCPWKKCKFCAHKTSFRENYNERSPQNVVDEMEYMYKNYGTRLFHFADETISAEHGAQIGEIISNRRLPFYWMSFGRLDEEFNEVNLSKWYKGGARVIEWGLETASDKVLESMNKGITVKKAQEIIHIAGKLGIKNKLLTWHNYPGEDIDDLLKTINFVSKNVREGFAAPMLTLKQKLVLQIGSELYTETFLQKKAEKQFDKVWLPDSIYSINASYFQMDGKDIIKQRLILPYIKEMQEYCKTNDIFIATNENISFDLIINQVKEG